jgi:hypothetical protein
MRTIIYVSTGIEVAIGQLDQSRILRTPRWTPRCNNNNEENGIVVYRAVARQRLQNKRVQPLLCNRRLQKMAVSKQLIGKHASTAVGLLLETVYSIRSVQSGYKEGNCTNQFSWGLAVHMSSARETEKRWRYSCEGKSWLQECGCEKKNLYVP